MKLLAISGSLRATSSNAALVANVKRGAIIKSAPGDKPWGVRELQVADPDGNVLRIGSPLRH